MILLISAFTEGQIIGTMFVSRILAAIVELILMKVFKLNKKIAVVASMVVAFVIYLLPSLLVSSSIPGADPGFAAREAEVNQGNLMFFGMWLMVWTVVDLVIVSLVGKRVVEDAPGS